MENLKEYYLKEFKHFDGENDITFNIIDVKKKKKTIHLAITHCGYISFATLDLKADKYGNFYFEYGIDKTNINLDDFETIED